MNRKKINAIQIFPIENIFIFLNHSLYFFFLLFFSIISSKFLNFKIHENFDFFLQVVSDPCSSPRQDRFPKVLGFSNYPPPLSSQNTKPTFDMLPVRKFLKIGSIFFRSFSTFIQK